MSHCICDELESGLCPYCQGAKDIADHVDKACEDWLFDHADEYLEDEEFDVEEK